VRASGWFWVGVRPSRLAAIGCSAAALGLQPIALGCGCNSILPGKVSHQSRELRRRRHQDEMGCPSDRDYVDVSCCLQCCDMLFSDVIGSLGIERALKDNGRGNSGRQNTKNSHRIDRRECHLPTAKTAAGWRRDTARPRARLPLLPFPEPLGARRARTAWC